MSSGQKNILLVIMVLAVVALAVYDSQTSTPPSEQSDSTAASSDTEEEAVSSSSGDDASDSSTDPVSETPDTEQTSGDTDDAGDTSSNSDRENADREEAANTQSDSGEDDNPTITINSTTASSSSDTQSESADEPPESGDDPSESDSSGDATPVEQDSENDSRTYEVREGDSLGEIAEQFYGSKSNLELIRQANPDAFSSTNEPEAGTTLTIPKPDSDTSDTEEDVSLTAETSTEETSAEETSLSPQDAPDASDETGSEEQTDDSGDEEQTPSDDEGTTGTTLTNQGDVEWNPPFEAGPDKKWYRVKDGDSLWKISEKEYGAGKYFSDIWELNKDRLDDYNHIRPGTLLLLPENPSRQ